MKNTKLFGFDNLEKAILSDFYRDRLHHSILLNGQKGVGKATFAFRLANKILSTKKNNKPKPSEIKIDDLDENSQTYKLIKARSHPDLLVIERGVNGKTKKIEKEIKVEAVREINGFMTLTSSFSDYKVVIIDSADEMNINAQNAILKVLEEPNDDSFLILVSHNSSALLDTIRSRCHIFPVKSLSYDEWKNAVMNYLSREKLPALLEKELKTLSVLSNNSVFFALKIVELDGLEFYRQILNILSASKPNTEEIHVFADSLKNNKPLLELFEFLMEFFVHRLVKVKLNQKIGDYISEEEKKALETIANKNKTNTILGKFEYLKQLLRDMKRKNLNVKHCLTVLFTKMIY